MGKVNIKGSFDRKELLEYMRDSHPELSQASFKVKLQKMLAAGEIVRIGRNVYRVCDENKEIYWYEYSDYANKIANYISVKYPKLDFRIFELAQLNELINHQIAHNILFISVEVDLGEFVFETLKEKYPGKTLFKPTSSELHRYWVDEMIVIEKLITEAPRGKKQKWNTTLEKLLVDILRDDNIKSNFSESEIPTIFENSFEKYIIDESMLKRYAGRRTATKEIMDIIKNKTNIKLKVWGNN